MGLFLNSPQKKSGMTLIELIVSIGILGIILVAFINMFVFGAVNIFNAGSKGVAYMSAQRIVDTQLANNEANEEKEISITFNTKTITIPGGAVQSSQTHGSQTSNQEVFIPYVPTISSIGPSVISEGQLPLTQLNIIGKNTNFSNATYAQIYDFFGSLVYTINSSDVVWTDATNIVLKLPLNNTFINSKSNYVLRIITPMSGSKLEIVRAKFSVTIPKMVLVSTDKLFVSATGEYWLERSAMANFPSFDNITSGVYGNERYLATDSMGRIFTTTHRQNWNSGLVSPSEKMNGAYWSSYLNKYFLVSETGKVWSSSDLSTWTLETHFTHIVGETTNPVALISIIGDSSGRLLVAGSGGSILRYDSVNGWIPTYGAIAGYDIKDVYLFKNDFQSFFVLIGTGGKVYTSGDGVVWTEDVIATGTLNSIDYDSKNNRLILVGTQGTISYASPVINMGTGKLNWTSVSLSSTLITQDFTNIFYHMENDKVVVSTSDTVYTFKSDFTEYDSTLFSGQIINDIFGQ